MVKTEDHKEKVNEILQGCFDLVQNHYAPTEEFTIPLCTYANELLKYETSEGPWFYYISYEFADAIRYLTSGMYLEQLEDCKKGLMVKIQDRLIALRRPHTTVWLTSSPVAFRYEDLVYREYLPLLK